MAETSLLPAYLVVGADEYKRSKTMERMRARLEKSGMADFNLDERDMSKDPEVDDIIASLNTLPMGADFRLVILHGCDRLPRAVSEPLVSYLASPSPTTVCLLIAEKLAKNTRLYKAVAKVGPKAIIDCTPKKAYEMPRQVVAMARAHGRQITLPAAEELVSRAGTDARMLDNELKKLFQMVKKPQVDVDDVRRLVSRTAEAKPWELLDAVSARNLPKALELLEMQPANSEVRLYALLIARVRELICAKALDARGAGRSLASTLGLQAWQVKNHSSWARKYAMDELLDALARAADLELALKGSRDSALALRLWIVALVGKDR